MQKYISLSEAAKRLQITRQALYKKMNDEPVPAFFVDVRQDGDKRTKPAWRVDVTSREWQALERKYRETADVRAMDSMSKSDGQKLAIDAKRLGSGEPVKKAAGKKKNTLVQQYPDEADEQGKPMSPDLAELHYNSMKAKKEREIHITKINKEKAAQQEILTLEKKREIAPVSMIQHFFSFGENMIQRIYRRPHEIGPQLAALYQAHEDKKAEQLLIRELEGIVVDSQKELLKAMKDEGYRLRQETKKAGGKKGGGETTNGEKKKKSGTKGKKR